jgi:predicted lipid-binding transport protein (Tim44 family)
MWSPLSRVTPFVMALALALPPVAVAQQASAPLATVAVHPDSTPEAAAALGRAAAERPGMGGRFAGGFAGGLTLGLIGTGVVYAIAAGSNADLPAEQAAQVSGASPEYREAYQQAYRDRLRSRRKSSALTGGLVGTALIVTIVLASQSN